METGLVFLGTSAGVPTKRRWLPSIAFIYRGRVLLMDCGEGCQYRLQEAGISPLRIDYIAITHLHGDHFLGLLGLLQTMTMNNRRQELHVYAPCGLTRLLEDAFDASGHKPAFPLKFICLEDGLEATLWNKVSLRAFRVDHGGIEAYGFVLTEAKRPGKLRVEVLKKLGLEPGPYLAELRRGRAVVVKGVRLTPEMVFEEPRRGVKLVYTGDTKPCRRVLEEARGADVLIHDSTFDSRMSVEAHEQGHSTASDAGMVASEARVGLLVLTHFSSRYRSVSHMVVEAKRYHPHVVAAEDLMKLVIRL